MIDDEILAGIEAVLMVTDTGVSAAALASAMGIDEDTVLEAIAELKRDYDGDAGEIDGASVGAAGDGTVGGGPGTAGRPVRRQRGFELRRVAGGFRIFSRGDYHDIVRDFLTAGQTSKLSQAALETLAVIAYRQPISRPRIAAIRGVSVDGVIRTLLLRGLIVEAGKEATTSALLYATTHEFLDTLGVESLDALPDIAPYLPTDAEATELSDEREEVLAEVEGEMSQDGV